MTLKTPTLAEVVLAALHDRESEMRIGMPGKITDYDPSTQLASVKPLLKIPYIDADGDRKLLSLPIATNVPVLFQGGNGFRVLFEPVAGDTVWLMFADRSLERWLDNGLEVDPGEERMHHLSDAVAIPGLHAKANAWTGSDPDAMTIGEDGGTQIRIEKGGGPGTTPVAKVGSTVTGTAGPWPLVSGQVVSGSDKIKVP